MDIKMVKIERNRLNGLFILYKYIKGRSTVKKAFREQEEKVENEPTVTKSRNRKTSKPNKRVNTKRTKDSSK